MVHTQGSIIAKWTSVSLNILTMNPCSRIYVHQSSHPGSCRFISMICLIYEFFFQGCFRSVYKPQNYKAQNGFCELSCPHLFTWPKSFLDISKPKLKVKFLHLCTKGCSGVVKIFHILIVMVFTPQLWKLTNHLKSVHFIVCKLCLNKINLRKT